MAQDRGASHILVQKRIVGMQPVRTVRSPIAPKNNPLRSLQPKAMAAAPPVYRPVHTAAGAPPVYRPNLAAPLQRKAVAAVYRPAKAVAAAPAVYRPNAAAPLQRKASVPVPAVFHPAKTAMAAPAVYRPNLGAPLQPKHGLVIANTYRSGLAAPQQRTMIAGRTGPATRVVQRAELLSKAVDAVKAVTMSIIYTKPNPFAMENFTSCICFVFNVAGKTQAEFTEGLLYRYIFDSIKSTWQSRKSKGPFYALCPYEPDGSMTQEWKDLCTKTDFGDRPLIVVIGHCSPGRSTIQNDAHDTEYTITEVIQAISPVFRKRCTIYLTPCHTGVASAESKSFQDQFTAELNDRGTEYFTIGTGSTSVPWGGQVMTTDQTYTHMDMMISPEAYLEHQKL